MYVGCQGEQNVVDGETCIFLGVTRCSPSSWGDVTQFPNPIHDTWEPLAHLTGSEHIIREFNKEWEQDYLIKPAETLQTVTVSRNSDLEKYTKKVCEGQTTTDIEETMGEGGGDDDEEGESEDEDEDGEGTRLADSI